MPTPWTRIAAGASIHAARFRAAVAHERWDAAVALAQAELGQGASVVDVCFAGHPEEAALLPAFVGRLRAAGVEAPIWADSRDVAALTAAAARLRPGDALNSVHLAAEEANARRLAALAHTHGLDVVALALDGRGPSVPARVKLDVAARLLALLDDAGVSPERVWLDLVALPSPQPDSDSARATLAALAAATERWGSVRTVLGVHNVGWGLARPERTRVEDAFLAAALSAGLDAAFTRPLPSA